MKFALIEVALNKDSTYHWKIKKKKESQNVMNQQYCYWRPGRDVFFSFLADLAKVADCSDYVVDCLIQPLLPISGFVLDERFQRNASKFAIFHIGIQKPKVAFSVFHFAQFYIFP